MRVKRSIVPSIGSLAVFLLFCSIIDIVQFTEDKHREFDDSLIVESQRIDPSGKLNDDSIHAKDGKRSTDDEKEKADRKMSTEGYSADERKLRDDEEKHEFQAEVTKLMNIIVNSIYSNKEIFLRELISNASDALDKIRFIGILDPAELGEGENAKLQIKIRVNEDEGTIDIIDSGIGMTRQELVDNLGTIAHSGTAEFLHKMGGDVAQTDTSMLIGQFGVGFYSSYLVADKVVVTSKSNKDPNQHIWESAADAQFTVREDPAGNTLGRGTKVTLHLKDRYYLHTKTIEELVKKYSEFINFPIYLHSYESFDREEVDEEAMQLEAEALADSELETVEAGKTQKPREEIILEKLKEIPTRFRYVEDKRDSWKLINAVKPLWMRPPNEVSAREYSNFYTALTRDERDPLCHAHFEAEGDADFRAVFFVPPTQPEFMWDTNREAHKNDIRLYVRRVFITGDFFELFPTYLRFIRGVIDSDDLPLNVSRETIQESRQMGRIKRKAVRKVLQMLQDLVDNEPEQFELFYAQYSYAMKVGLIEDVSNRSRIAKLIKFASSKSENEKIFLDEYVRRMKEGQKNIYFIAGDDAAALAKSPVLERLLAEDIEVLFLTEAIDESAVMNLHSYESKYRFVNAAKDLDDLEDLENETEDEKLLRKEKEEEIKKDFSPLTKYLKRLFKEKLEKVQLSDKLVRTPAAIVSTSTGYSANMERLMKAHAMHKSKRMEEETKYEVRKVMELNPAHPLIIGLNNIARNDRKSKTLRLLSRVLYDTALLNSGFTIDDPARYASLVHRMAETNLEHVALLAAHEDEGKDEREDEDEKEEDGEKEERREDKEEQTKHMEDEMGDDMKFDL